MTHLFILPRKVVQPPNQVPIFMLSSAQHDSHTTCQLIPFSHSSTNIVLNQQINTRTIKRGNEPYMQEKKVIVFSF